MRWMPIAVCGVLIGITTYLVKDLTWNPMWAMLAVAGMALVLPLGITLVILVFVDAPQRRELWDIVWKTARADLKEILDVLRFRR